MTGFDLSRLLATPIVDRVEYQPVLPSTNDRAREFASHTPAGTTLLVVADEQTAGRGRGSNRWWTGPGSIAFSLLVDLERRGIERRWTAMIALATAIAVVEAVRPRLPIGRIGLHWPNDVFVDHRKLAGVLVEALPDGRYIVGLGVNVNNSACQAPAELADMVTSVADLTGAPCDRTELLASILEELGVTLDVLARDPHELGRYADRCCLQHGHALTVSLAGQEHRGRCLGIAEDGALLLDCDGRPERFYSGVLLKP
ncbi:MAG TPA: biotin--[acetyl-CoA-carboxylase] ligase [Pirellulales bacterium]|nr:biotin--[acetyl-CoA-carboxylase] ligase [Pirellulales bacterium]